MTLPCELKTILFDMGNVLVFFSHERMCRQMAEVCGCSEAELTRQLMASGCQADFERGLIDERELHNRFEALFQRPIDFDSLCEASGNIFQLNASIIPVLEELKRLRLRLVLLSNTCTTHVRVIRRNWNVLNYFDHLIVSYEVGAVKPESAIYQAALNSIECHPSEALYTDDILEYVETGKSYGLSAVQFSTTERFVSDLRQYGIEIPSTGR
ncbi:HAD-IA family hydrolase [Planctomicrobium sp. SH527]|uniref:HAD-IA family hydrolase n=1 Tax=Planctomicrobium sp. SH527 TaxID=3448123 RepID=UPI003F5AF139